MTSSNTATSPVQAINKATQDQLKSMVSRIEKMEEEKKAMSEDIGSIYQEIKSAGFDPKVVKEIIRIRKKQPHEIQEMEELLDLYKQALGMI